MKKRLLSILLCLCLALALVPTVPAQATSVITITAQPETLTLAENESISFSVTATVPSGYKLYYQWQTYNTYNAQISDFDDITDATEAEYTAGNMMIFSHGFAYRCKLTAKTSDGEVVETVYTDTVYLYLSGSTSHVHSWSSEWSSDTTYHWHECTADNCNYTLNNVKDGYAEHTLVWVDNEDNTHQQVCSVCGYAASEAAAHSYDVAFTWAEDYTSATATFTCSVCDYSVAVNCNVKNQITEATCEDDGEAVYTATATFDGVEYTDTQTVTTPAMGHDWVFQDEWYWAPTTYTDPDMPVYEAHPKFICSVCNEEDWPYADVQGETVSATCTADEYTVYTATYTYDGVDYIDTLTVTEEGTATGHSYSEPVFTWAEDYSTATAAFTCEACGDVQTVECTVTSDATNPTCTEAGEATYTAAVTFNETEYTDEQTVTIAATGHSYGEPTFTWAEDYSTAAANFACSGCGYSVTVDCEVESVTTEATCTADGYTVYTASVTYDGTAYTDKQTAADTGSATGHTWSDTGWTWAEGYSTATASFECDNCGETTTATASTADETITSAVTTAATCTATGIRTYTAIVTVDGAEYEGTVEEEIPTTAHSYGDEWKSSENGHWQACSVCGDPSEAEAHSFDDGEVTTAATATSTGVMTYTCSVCGYEKTEEIPMLATYTVIASAGEGGTVDCDSSVVEGGSATVTITPDTGYAIASVKVGETDVTSAVDENNQYTIDNVQENVTVTATFKKLTYTVTVSGSYADATGAGTYEWGATVTLDAGTNTGYLFDGWTSDDVTFADGSEEASFIMPQADVTVTANWTLCDHTNNENNTSCTEETTCSQCGGTVAATGHSYETTWTSDETDHWHQCSVCGDVADQAEHTFGDWTDNFVTMTRSRSCSVCDYTETRDICTVTIVNYDGGDTIVGFFEWGETVEISAGTNTGYLFDGWTSGSDEVVFNDAASAEASFTMPQANVTVTANWTECDHTGNENNTSCTEETTCSQCGGTVAATGHSYGDTQYTWDEADGGYTCTASHICAICDTTETAQGTVSGTQTIDPTCTEKGEMTYTATFDGCEWAKEQTTTADIAPTGHTYGEPVFAWADDYSTATAAFTCEAGDDTVELDCEVNSVTTAASCTVAGETVYTAAVTFEGTTYTETQTVAIPAAGHSWGDWETVTSPTCEGEGSERRVCAVCGLTETQGVDAAGHSWETEYTIDQAATCTTDGSQSIHCANCDAVKDSEVIPATGHSYEETVVAPTYTEEGYTLHTCTVCGHSYTTDPIPVLTVVIGETDEEEVKVETRTNTEELTAVPETLTTIYSTVEELTEDLTEAVVSRVSSSMSYTEDNVTVHDVTLQYQINDGEWIDATEENFPAAGITVTLPYPEGSGMDDDFVVAHMFTVTSEKLGTVAGETEYPAVTKTADGLVVTLKGLSPVAIAWTEGETTDTTNTTSTATATPAATTQASPPTGDDMAPALWLALLAITGCGLTAIAVMKKKKSRR